MRIVAGARRGATLYTGKSRGFRPTSDRVREAIFSILADRVEGARVADLFAGSGALGFEALSRGAAGVLFVEKQKSIARWIERNAGTLRMDDQCRIIRGDASRLVKSNGLLSGCDLVFADPPYGGGFVAPLVDALHQLPEERLLVLEREKRESHGFTLPEWTGSRSYGDTVIDFLIVGKEAPS